jgi:hypothetical protein
MSGLNVLVETALRRESVEERGMDVMESEEED